MGVENRPRRGNPDRHHTKQKERREKKKSQRTKDNIENSLYHTPTILAKEFGEHKPLLKNGRPVLPFSLYEDELCNLTSTPLS
jgi:hypothetical protein